MDTIARADPELHYTRTSIQSFTAQTLDDRSDDDPKIDRLRGRNRLVLVLVLRLTTVQYRVEYGLMEIPSL